MPSEVPAELRALERVEITLRNKIHEKDRLNKTSKIFVETKGNEAGQEVYIVFTLLKHPQAFAFFYILVSSSN